MVNENKGGGVGAWETIMARYRSWWCWGKVKWISRGVKGYRGVIVLDGFGGSFFFAIMFLISIGLYPCEREDWGEVAFAILFCERKGERLMVFLWN